MLFEVTNGMKVQEPNFFQGECGIRSCIAKNKISILRMRSPLPAGKSVLHWTCKKGWFRPGKGWASPCRRCEL